MHATRLASFILLCCASTARAEALHVEAPPGCITREELARRVDRELPLRVRIEGEPDLGWHAQLHWQDGRDHGERELTAGPGACSQLDEAITLVATTFLGAGDALERPLRRSLYIRRAPWRWRASFGGVLGTGALPAPFFALAAALEASRARLALRLGVLGAPRARSELGAGARGDFGALLARLAACGLALASERHVLEVCGGARLGPTFARTHGLAENARSLTLNAELELAARYTYQPAPRWGVYLGAAATLPVISNTYFIVEDAERRSIYHQTTPGVSAELGGLFAFSL